MEKVFLSVLISLYALTGYAQEAELSLPDLNVSPGEEFMVHVRVENVEDMMAFRVVFELPNTSADYPLEYVPGSSSVNGTLANGWISRENDSSTVNDPSTQVSGLVLINGSGAMPVSGSGILIKFKLRVKEGASEQIVPLQFVTSGSVTSRLNDGAIPVTFDHGSIQIGEPQIPTSTPIPTESPEPTKTPDPTETPELPTVTPVPTDTPLPTPTPITPTLTPSPSPSQDNIVIITDDVTATEDLSNGQDYDTPDERILVIRVDFALAGIDVSSIQDMHVYIKVNDAIYRFLGRTASRTASLLEWKEGTPHLASPFRDGPEFGNNYQFKVFIIKRGGFPPFSGPYENIGPVEYLLDETAVPTSTPSPTPSDVPLVSITDNETSETDLSNAQDHDDFRNPELVIRWDINQMGIDPNNIRDFHLYVQINQNGDYTYFGRTGSEIRQQLVWKRRTPLISPVFRNGPEFYHSYHFKIFAIAKRGSPNVYGPFTHAGPVEFLPIITVTDNLSSSVDLSNGSDYDASSSRDLVIRWTFDPSDLDQNNIRDYHLYVKADQEPYRFLGKTGNGTAEFFEWKEGTPLLSPTFQHGPEFGHTYRFKVYAIKSSGAPPFYGPFDNIGPVEYLQDETVPTPTPSPIPSPMITVTDNLMSDADISNSQDHDDVNDPELIIRWDFAQAGFSSDSVRDIHVYVQTDGSGDYDFLGRTGSGNDQYLTWKPRAPHIFGGFRTGPDIGHSYHFKVFAITKRGNPKYYGPFMNAAPVAMLPIVTVTDDTTTTIDLSNGDDIDTEDDRALVIRWMFESADLDMTDISDYHVYVKVNQHPCRFLGRTGSSASQYLEWKSSTPLLSSDFQNGPEFGNTYEFRMYAITESGTPKYYGAFDNMGPIDYRQSAVVEPTPTPASLPPDSPTPTPTPSTTPATAHVTVTDDTETFEDLSNGVDYDSEDERSLVIRWELNSSVIDVSIIRFYHIYVLSEKIEDDEEDGDNNNSSEYEYLGRTTNEDIYVLEWKENNPLIKPSFRNGPQFGYKYQFQVYAITRNRPPSYYGPFDTQGPVQFLSTN